jgi:hypothetical protein
MLWYAIPYCVRDLMSGIVVVPVVQVRAYICVRILLCVPGVHWLCCIVLCPEQGVMNVHVHIRDASVNHGMSCRAHNINQSLERITRMVYADLGKYQIHLRCQTVRYTKCRPSLPDLAE